MSGWVEGQRTDTKAATNARNSKNNLGEDLTPNSKNIKKKKNYWSQGRYLHMALQMYATARRDCESRSRGVITRVPRRRGCEMARLWTETPAERRTVAHLV